MKTTKWFLAHSRHDDDSDIDTWVADTEMNLQSSGDCKVIAGRDDYKSRAAAMGGWTAWCSDVSIGESYSGEPMFDGIIVPVCEVDSVSVGRATAQLLEGFLGKSKRAIAWHVEEKVFFEIVGVQPTESGNYSSWSNLLIKASH